MRPSLKHAHWWAVGWYRSGIERMKPLASARQLVLYRPGSQLLVHYNGEESGVAYTMLPLYATGPVWYGQRLLGRRHRLSGDVLDMNFDACPH